MNSPVEMSPIPLVEELVLEPSEEPLAGGVVGVAALCGHAPDEPLRVADADPLGPAAVAAAVRADGRSGAFACGSRAGLSSRAWRSAICRPTGMTSKQSTTALRQALLAHHLAYSLLATAHVGPAQPGMHLAVAARVPDAPKASRMA